MQEILSLIEGYIRGMWRYRWYALTVSWALSVGGWLWVYSLPDIYQASTRVFVDAESTLRKVLDNLAIQSDLMSEVTMVSEALRSRPIVEKVARETDFELRAKTPADRERLISDLQSRIQTDRDRREHLFAIRFQDHDREMAQKVVAALLSTFMEDALDSGSRESNTAELFIQDKIFEYEARLTEAEDRLADFKRRNIGTMPGEGGGYYARLQSAMAERDATKGELNLAMSKREELLHQLQGEVPVFGYTPQMNRRPTAYDAQINTLQAELAQLSVNFTDKHPRIGQIKDQLERLEKLREEELAAMPDVPTFQTSSPLDQNPVYQQLRISLSTAEVEIKTLQRKLAEQEARVRSLTERVDTIPEVEAELARLNRDYEITKRQYEEFVKRLEFMRNTRDVEANTEDVKFQVIDPPLASARPVAPNRPLLLAAVLIGALGAGLSLAFLLHQARPVFLSRDSLRRMTNLPVLGSISVFRTARQRAVRRLRLASFTGATLMLLVTFGAAVMLSDSGAKLTATVISELAE